MEQLLFAPQKVFQYYIFAYVKYLHSSRANGDWDSESAFLRLLRYKEERNPGSVKTIYPRLHPTLAYIASKEYFRGAIEVEDFNKIGKELDQQMDFSPCSD